MRIRPRYEGKIDKRPLRDHEWEFIWRVASTPWRGFFERLAPPEQEDNIRRHPADWDDQ